MEEEMKVEVKKLDKLKRVITIEVSGEDFQKDKKEVYQEAGKNLKVAGFRPGTVPLDVLEKQHGSILKDEFLKKMVPVYYQKAIEQSNLSPIILPRIFDMKIEKDSVGFSAEVEVKPEIELKDSDYKGIKIKDKKIDSKEDEIQKVLNNLKEGVKKVVERDLSDEELGKWAGYSDFQTLKEAIKTEVGVEKLRARRQEITAQVTTHLLKNIKVDVSKTEVERHQKELVDREVYNLQQRGVPEKDIEKYKKDIEEKIKPMAENEIKLLYILDAIANKENIKAGNNFAEAVLGFILSQAQFNK
jgi:FKBP-type peptidyl-prolyl cis-trans isomerase (trigger factor)